MGRALSRVGLWHGTDRDDDGLQGVTSTLVHRVTMVVPFETDDEEGESRGVSLGVLPSLSGTD